MRPHLNKYVRSRRFRFIIALATLFGLLTIMSEGFAVDITSITAQWQSPTGSSGAPTCLNVNNASGTVEVRYGDDDVTNPPCPATSVQSGFGFTAGTSGTFADGTPFLLGQLTHYNNQVFASSLLTGASLNLSFASSAPVLPALDTQVTLDETANNLTTCPYGDTAPCADRVSITPSTTQFTDNGNTYQLEVVGLIPGTAATCTFNQANVRLSFISDENQDNSSCLFGRVTSLGDAEMQIEKTTTATTLVPGALVDYQIDYTCASTTSTCNGVKIIDYLPDELLYVGSTGSTHTVSAVGTYSAGSNTIQFTFIDPLPAGSTGYVRIRARVRNDGTLGEGQIVTNTGTSTQTNGPTATTTVGTPVHVTSNWDVTKTGDTIAYISSEIPVTDMTYTVSMCPAGSNVNLLNAQIVDTLPTGAVFVSATGGGIYSAGTNTVTWTLGDVAASAPCNSQTVVVRFPNPPFAAGQTVVNSVTGTGTVPGVGPFTDTATVSRVLQNFVPVPSVSMNKGTTRSDYVVGSSIDYFLRPRNSGNSNLYNLIMTDDLPAAIRVTKVESGVSAYPMVIEYALNGSSTYVNWANVPANTNSTLQVSTLGLQPTDWITSVRWRFNPGAGTLPNWQLTSPATITGTITSPDRTGTAVTAPQQIVNNARLDWAYFPGGVGTCTDPGAQCGSQNGGATIDVTTIPVPVFDKVSGGGVSSNQRFLVNQQIGYFDLTVNNNTGIPVDLFTITDDIPAPFNVTTINIGTYSNYSSNIGVRYQVNDVNTWINWPGSPVAPGSTLNAATLGLPANTYISKLEFSYGTIPAGFYGAPRINGITLPVDRNGVTVVDGANMTNNASFDWRYNGSPNTRTKSTTNPIRVPTVTPSASKTVTSNGPYIPTSAVKYRLSFGAAGNSPSNVMNNPIVADLLPANVNYVGYTYGNNGTALPAPTFQQIPNYGGTGRTLLRWTFTGTLNRGQNAYIDLDVTLSAGTPSGSLDNTFAVTVNDMPVNSTTPDSQDLDGDGQTSDFIITSTTSIPVDQLVGLESQKRVRGQLDADYSVFPNYGHTVPNGSVEYRLTIVNRGNIPVNNVRVIDILPFPGDTGVQDIRQRRSAWRPSLTGPITPQAGVTIYYSTATNPCRPEIVTSGPAGCTAPNWSLTPPSNIDNVRSLRFDFAGTMAPAQSFAFNWTMRAPATGTDKSIAWNSFAFTSTNALTNVPLRPAEPNKVGIVLETTPLTSLISLKKFTNGEDADLAPGPLVSVTGTVTWTYVVTNIGQTRLGSIVLTDNLEGTISCPKSALDANESMTCTKMSGSAPQLGQYSNTSHVVGTAVDINDVPLDGDTTTPGTQLIQPVADDPSHYFGYDPTTARLGNYTWIDLNYNGLQDAGEPVLGGVTIHLLNAAGNPVDDPIQAGVQPYITTSDSNGFYNFVNLPIGDYIVQFDTPSAYIPTVANATPDSDDSDADTTTGKTAVYHLNAAEYNDTVDAGFIAPASLGDRVWMDTNGNGIQDVSETTTPTIIEGLRVDLLNSTGTTTLYTTYTDPSGYYNFNNLLPGTYILQFPAPPTGYIWTALNAPGATIDDGSDINVATYRTTAFVLAAGQNDPSWDAGLTTTASIGNFVWADNNFDGLQSGGEPGVANVTVRLLNSSGTQATDDNGVLIPDVLTSASGAYSFTNLRPGNYEVQFTLPTGYIFTTKDAGSDTLDSDAIVTGANAGRTSVTNLSPNETDNSWDAGLIKLASLGNFVWQDTNNNGQQDGGEPGVAGAIVTLLDNTGTPVTTDALGNAITPITTPASGAYSFTNLDPRVTYIVQFERPVGYVFAISNTGSDTTDSDAVPSSTLPLGIGRTGTITLTAGQNDLTVDAGLVVAASIGDYVFYDNDNNGSQNAGDTPVQGVTVRLLNGAGNQATDERGSLIADQVTDASGNYHFTGLIPGTYSLTFSTLPASYTFARRDVGADAVDSDPNRYTGSTVTTTLDPGENDNTWDTGLVLAASLGDFVWIDTNANGQQDVGENGLAGVTVRLLDASNNPIDNPNTAAIADAYIVTTDVNGNYSFVGLPPNENYRVRWDRPTGYLFTLSNSGADATDSDGNLAGQTNVANTTTITISTLTPGATDNTWDQGVLLPSALGNFVWRDNNSDGLQTAGEPGIASVTVNLLDSAGVAVDNPNTNGTQNYTVTTPAGTSGIYAFTNLYPGNYIVEFITPAGGFKRTAYFTGAGANAATDSNVQTLAPNAGRTPVIALPYNTTDNTWDAGFVPLASLGDFVWRDNNNNGQQDVGEPGIANVTVTLLDSLGVAVTTNGLGAPVTPVLTTGTGAYGFTNLDPDIDYIIQFTLPTPAAGASGYKFSPQDSGADATDSDANVTTGRTAVIPLNPAQIDNSWDAGLTPLAQLGDYVWTDTNGNGRQDAGETGLNGVTVELYAAANLVTPLANTLTTNNPVGGAAGYYQFLNLDAGNYVVKFTLLPGYIFTYQDAAVANDATDSDANRFTGLTGTYTLSWGGSNQTADAGMVPPASLGDYVWYDTNNDGLQTGETGQNGVIVRLLDTSNNPVDNPNTAAVNDAYFVTTANNPVGGAPGYYLFNNLIPGDYRVQFDLAASTLPQASSNYVFSKQNQGGDDSIDSDPDRITGITATIHLNAGQNDVTNDAGILLRAGNLGNRVWIDLNNNGIQDSGEVGLNGVTVTLLNGSGGTDIDPITPGTQTLSTTTVFNATVGNGYYQFTGLIPDTYIVQVTLPAGYQFSQPDLGGNDNNDSDVNITTGRTTVITLVEGTSDETWDAGVVPLASIGDYVWRDNNNNGLQDVGEPFLSGVTVRLLTSAGAPADDPNTAGFQAYVMNTDASGNYRFTNLAPDTSYIVQFDLPLHYRRSPVDANSNANDATDSDADLTNGRSPATLLGPGIYNNTVDAGFVPLATIGDYVWGDTDGDGVQEAGETGLNNVTVRLYDAGNLATALRTTTTANNPVGGAPGYYQFADIDAGNYVVEFVLPLGGYNFTRQNINSAATTPASTDANDSDPDRVSGQTASYAINWGDSNQTIDAGMLLPATLGNFVWVDTDDDGVQDGTETGLNGVTVRLLDGSGNPIDNPNTPAVGDAYTTLTIGNGAYSFTGLFPGSYIVEFVLPSPDYVFSRQNINSGATTPISTDSNDSDADRTTGRTGTYTLTAGQTDNSVDAGMMLRASFGDFVWNDLNGDGIQGGAGENGLPNVTVTLRDGTGALVDNPNTPAVDTYIVQTDVNGAYTFTNLIPGDYYVVFTPPAGYIFTRPDVGGNDAVDSDADRFTGRTITTTLISGENDLSWDAGMLQPAAIGDYVWIDTDDDGVQDGTETGLNGITVRLLDGSGNPVDNPNTAAVGDAYTTATLGAGAYSFTGLFPGSYIVEFVLPNSTYAFARQNINSGATTPASNDTNDSDVDRTTGRTGAYTLIAGQTDNSVDAGMLLRASLGDYVWNDLNGDGIQAGPGENGVQNVTVTLRDGTGALVDNPNTPAADTYVVQTDVNGAYNFTNLVPGNYYVVFTLPAGYMFTRQDVGGNDAVDSDADRFTGRTVTTTLISGEVDQTWDAGILQPATLGNFVWVDTDDDGVQDGTETGLNGVTVRLLDNSGTPVDNPNTSTVGDAYTTATLGAGAYSFTGLFPGSYIVEFVLPSPDYVFSRQNINSGTTTPASNDTNDSDADRTTGRTGTYTLTAGQTDNSVDAGMMLRASFGDFVWNDLNGDGIQGGAGENGLPNVTVTLRDGTGALVDNPNTPAVDTYIVQTDVNGAYTFTNLIPGDYYVVFTPPAGYIFTRPDVGGNDTVDSDADRFTGRTITTTLISGENDLSWDAGMLQPAALGNFVWDDLDDNGTQNNSEPGIQNVTVSLLNNLGTPVDNPNTPAVGDAYVVTTDNNGAYAFTGLFPGFYIVQFTLPSGNYVFARLDVAAATDAADSDANRTTGRTGAYTLIAGQTDNSVDAGMMLRASIGDFVWRDLNDNGIQDGGEPGLNGVTVRLTDENGVVTTTTTAGGGAYLFPNLVPGNYSLQFVILSNQYEFSDQNQGTNPNRDSDADFTTGTTVVTHLTSGENDTSWDAGMVPLASIGDRVWIDINNNGVQDGGEFNYQNATVNLLSSTGTVLATRLTDVNGNYLFDRLTPGRYAIQVILPAGYQFSLQDRGGSNSADSDVDPLTGQTIVTTLIPDQHDMSWDAGLVPLTSVGDRVWIDINNNGIQDGGEANFAGATVRLLNSTGSTVIATRVTDANGNYLFDLLPPNDYRIEFVLPPGYQFSPQDVGADATDSDANFTTGRTVLIPLPPDTHDTTRDAGLVPLTSIGDRVWRDLNGNGIQDNGELGLAGVTVRLIGLPGNPTTVTDSNGNYVFTALPPGNYAIEVVVPNHYIISPLNAGGNPATDSDVDTTTGRSVTTTLDPDEDDMTWDIGLVPLASLGDRVWLDANANGLQDSGELGVPNITVRLLDGTGTFIRQMLTDANGLYLFENLMPGNYIVEVVKPAAHAFSPLDVGGNDTVDSDVNLTTGRTAVTAIAYGDNNLTLDAGLVPLGKIGDFVWDDTDGDGVQDAGELGIPNVRVTLTYPNGTAVSMLTDATGKYLFADLPAGNYTVTVDPTTLPPDMGQTYDLNGPRDNSATYTLGIGETVLTLDFGYVVLGSIGDTVWLDRNRNGIQDPTEPGIGGVLVTLVLPDGTTITAVTDINGNYLFDDLYPGVYRVVIDITTVPGLENVADPDGLLDAWTDVDLSEGEHHVTADFGFAPPPVPPQGVPPINPTPVPTGTGEVVSLPPVADTSATTCQRACLDWQLYHSNRTGDWEIFRLDQSGDPLNPTIVSTNLSQGVGSDDSAPTRSPNAEWIVFSSNRDGNWELYLAPSNGDASRIQRLTYNTVANDTDPVWGPNNFVVYETTRDGNWELYLLDMTTGKQHRLTDNPASDINPYWSTDGKKLLFQSDRTGLWQIYEFDLETGTIKRLTDGKSNDIDPQYSNDSSLISFRSYRDGDKSTLYVMDADGTEVRRISDVKGDATNQSWSTDDNLIAYQSDLDGDLDIYVYDRGADKTRKLTDNSIPDYAPTWLCNGTIVIFTSDIDGNANIYDADAEPITAPAVDLKKAAEQLTDDPASDIYPENSPSEENASREGHLPGIILGEQTDFLLPDLTMTETDPSLDTGNAFEALNACSTNTSDFDPFAEVTPEPDESGG